MHTKVFFFLSSLTLQIYYKNNVLPQKYIAFKSTDFSCPRKTRRTTKIKDTKNRVHEFFFVHEKHGGSRKLKDTKNRVHEFSCPRFFFVHEKHGGSRKLKDTKNRVHEFSCPRFFFVHEKHGGSRKLKDTKNRVHEFSCPRFFFVHEKHGDSRKLKYTKIRGHEIKFVIIIVRVFLFLEELHRNLSGDQGETL